MKQENLNGEKRKKKNLIIKALKILITEGPVRFIIKLKKYIIYKFNFLRLLFVKDELKKAFTENMQFKNILQKKTLHKIKIFLSNKNNVISFPKYKKPKISIILITFNKVFYTFRCLESIKAFADVPYEIVFVDNGSKDETTQVLNRLKNVKIIRNPENMGFVKAGNQASKISSGKFLLFLNNDTEILPTCFSNLVRTIENNKKCGAVGARLIFPSGRLQEAGISILQNGITQEYGFNDYPLKPEYSYVRDVDYCAGACLLVRSDLFNKFGGFDERYAPGYYEECDFCVQLRKKGYTILYQPVANVIHYLCGSSNLNYVNKIAIKNLEKFKKKWKKYMKKTYPSNSENMLFVRDKCKGKRILIVDDRLCAKYSGQNHSRMYDLMHKLIDSGHKLTFLPLQESRQIQPETDYFQQLGVEVIYYNPQQKKGYIWNFLHQRKYFYNMIIFGKTCNAKEISVIKKFYEKSELMSDDEAYKKWIK